MEYAPWPSTRSAGYVKSVGVATRRAARNAFSDLGPRTTLRAGGKLLSTVNAICPVQPFRKKYSLSPSGKSVLPARPVPFPARGAYRDRHERGTGCGGREQRRRARGRRAGLKPVSDLNGAQDERRFERTAKPCGPDTRCWCQVGGDSSTRPGRISLNPPTTVTRRIRRRGEHGISRKAITQGMPGASAEPVCSCAPFSICVRDRGCSAPPAFPAPSDCEGRRLRQSSGAVMPRECERYVWKLQCKPHTRCHRAGLTGRPIRHGLLAQSYRRWGLDRSFKPSKSGLEWR